MSFVIVLENENSEFSVNVFNKNFCLNNQETCLKFSMHVPHNHIEGTVSQILELGLSFYFYEI